jgi:uncharacterized protein (TIGR00369 family)
MTLALKLDRDGVNTLLMRAFPETSPDQMALVTELEPGRARVRRPYATDLLRPGGVVSGPTLMGVADCAAYALILGHLGEELMAVTSSLTIHFLRGAQPGDVMGEATFLRLGRRIAVCDLKLWTERPDRLAAQASVTYALPMPQDAPKDAAPKDAA